MAYYFAVETAKDSYVAINARKTGFGPKPTGKKLYEFTLEDIDRYTTKFPNEDKFIRFLLDQKMINGRESEQRIGIVFSANEEKGCRVLPGGFIYRPYATFLQEPTLVLDYIVKKIEEEDYDFFEKLVSFLPTKKGSRQLAKVLLEINEVLHSSASEKSKERHYKLYLSSLKRLITFDKKHAKRKVYFYENLHTLVAFIGQYATELEKVKTVGDVKIRKKAMPDNM